MIINGGSFDGNNDGLFADGAPVAIFGGTYSGNANADLTAISGGSFTLYGSFGALAGQVLTGSGTFTGTLQNDNVPQTFTYDVQRPGGVVLDAPAVAAVPESSALAMLALGLLMAGLTLDTRKRNKVA